MTLLRAVLVAALMAGAQPLWPQTAEPVPAQTLPDVSPEAAAIEALGRAVRPCWMVDPASAAGQVVVTLAFALSTEGLVVGGEVTLLRHGPAASPEAAEQAFQSARRAVLRCQGAGYALPPALYPFWGEVEMTFDPTHGLTGVAGA